MSYAALVYYTEEPKYNSAPTNTKQRIRFTKPPRPLSITINATYAGPSYYSEAPKYYSVPSYYTTKAFGYYTTTYASSVY
ncbi:hypothetical protein DAPPUDRAFT_322323 [Daphnia pulex]|uniref:Uncharacterized protein n=1 Tax=Daphnia pulex TaxID=6669 RepID=E9GVK9_DAPPU|nr:hypothetical protein DAPPUDRAFT_322323 [Daphnia pulex]|eukprot:EFX76430.1 hypothetical protein DAPPUDRAFT_322323 [Daphnia pulex]